MSYRRYRRTEERVFKIFKCFFIFCCIAIVMITLSVAMKKVENEKARREQTLKSFDVPPLTEDVIRESDERIQKRVRNWKGYPE